MRQGEARRTTAALAELEIWRGELEWRLTETTDQLSAAKATRAEDESVMGRLSGELADAKAKVHLHQTGPAGTSAENSAKVRI